MGHRVNSTVLLVAGLAIAGWSLQWYNATAQEEAEREVGASKVAVLDVGLVFKKCDQFNEQLVKMKLEVKEYEGELKVARAAIQDLVEQFKPLKPGTDAHATLQRQIAQDTAALQVETGLKRQEFVTREASLYAKTYSAITQEVARFSRANNIAIVIRYNSVPIDTSDPKKILEGVNRSVVFQEHADITDDIILVVNARKEVELN